MCSLRNRLISPAQSAMHYTPRLDLCAFHMRPHHYSYKRGQKKKVDFSRTQIEFTRSTVLGERADPDSVDSTTMHSIAFESSPLQVIYHGGSGRPVDTMPASIVYKVSISQLSPESAFLNRRVSVLIDRIEWPSLNRASLNRDFFLNRWFPFRQRVSSKLMAPS